MTRSVRSGAEHLAATAFAILFVLSFDIGSAASARSTSPSERPVDDAAGNSVAGSVVFALSVAAVLAIGAFVAWRARKNRAW
jgi:hypothetical protein